mmetsp:Transcript_23695/g.40467  ORF Transcript_23695/g.40467 Transcript_23695/m.40467 type:complete len:371 (-) Transcript_23695:67-1179(-)
MAARKSCTHLTWSEAKSKVGGDSRTTSKKPLIPKKIDHGKALTAKVIAKNGLSPQDLAKEKTLARRAKRDEERAAAAAAKRTEERERRRWERRVRPLDMARERMVGLAEKLQKQNINGSDKEEGDGVDNAHIDAEFYQTVAECRELQVNELLGLEAIYNTHDGSDHNVDDDEDGSAAINKEFRISDASQFEMLQRLVEQWQIDPEDEPSLKKIVHHPNPSFTIQLMVDGTIHDDDCNDGKDVHLTAVLLLRVTLPSLYPSEEDNADDDDASDNHPNRTLLLLPTFDIAYFLCTHKDMECTPDKPLESVGHLDERKLNDAMMEEARQLLPDPCVYMVVTSVLMERLFEFVALSVRGKFILDQYYHSNHPKE